MVYLDVRDGQRACFDEDGVMVCVVGQAEGSPKRNDEQALELQHECMRYVRGQRDEWQSICNLWYEDCTNQLANDRE